MVLFDVNETLSDTSALAGRFEEVGAPGHLAVGWFAQVLRDGFALTATGDNALFASVAGSLLDQVLDGLTLDRPTEEAKEHLLQGFASIPLHPDVVPGLQALAAAGHRLVALTNGGRSTCATLLGAAGVDGLFEQLLSVEDAPTWKPGAGSYRWAAERCGVEPSGLMLVAVHPWDVHGAHRAGLATGWVNRAGRAYPPHFAAADLEVTSVVDLGKRLG